MPFCTECGAEVYVDEKFCTECGATVDVEATASEQESFDDDYREPVPPSADEQRARPKQQQPGQQPADPAYESGTDPGWPTGKKLAVGGVALSIVGAFLPWVSLGLISISGVRGGDGFITLAFAAISLGVVFLHGWGRRDRQVVGVLGVLTLLLGLFYIADPGFGIPQDNMFRDAVSPSFGIFLTAGGGLFMIVGSGYRMIQG